MSVTNCSMLKEQPLDSSLITLNTFPLLYYYSIPFFVAAQPAPAEGHNSGNPSYRSRFHIIPFCKPFKTLTVKHARSAERVPNKTSP